MSGAELSSTASSFNEVVELIRQSNARAYQAVNSELMDLYWRIGEYKRLLPEKALLRAKLHEFYQLLAFDDTDREANAIGKAQGSAPTSP